MAWCVVIPVEIICAKYPGGGLEEFERRGLISVAGPLPFPTVTDAWERGSRIGGRRNINTPDFGQRQRGLF